MNVTETVAAAFWGAAMFFGLACVVRAAIANSPLLALGASVIAGVDLAMLLSVVTR